jgi:hypothetical protein
MLLPTTLAILLLDKNAKALKKKERKLFQKTRHHRHRSFFLTTSSFDASETKLNRPTPTKQTPPKKKSLGYHVLSLPSRA